MSIEVAQRAGDGLNLANAATTIAGHLAANRNGIGPYMHGNRDVALLTAGSYHNMEYDGATTTNLGALEHEVYHSWWCGAWCRPKVRMAGRTRPGPLTTPAPAAPMPYPST